MFDEVDLTNRKIAKAENVDLTRINRSLNIQLTSIERIISRNWQRIKDQNLLPNEKTNALFNSIQVGNNDYTQILKNLYSRVRDESVALNRNWLTEQVAEFQGSDKLNDPLDFWVLDGNNRIGDWNNKFILNVRSAIQFGYQSRWSSDQVIAAVRQYFGQLQYQVKRVVATGSTGVTSGVSERLTFSNNLELVIFKTSERDNVCPYCVAREGNVYRVGEIVLPLHPECACWFLPVSKSQLRDKSFRDFLKTTRKESLAILAENKGRPNYGIAPFEKGLKKPPRPVFNPEKGFTWGSKKFIFDN
ncbi:MAG: hypothetical protein AB4372_23245 [Xenococcus sp. (in: cyanobacteria)]